MADRNVTSVYRKKRKRNDREERRIEQEQDTIRRRNARANIERRQDEKERNTGNRRAARENEERRQEEQERNTHNRRAARENEERRLLEKGQNTASRRVVREDEVRRQEEQKIQNESRRFRKLAKTTNWSEVLEDFQNRTKQGPTSTCVCCGGLFFLKSVKNITYDALTGQGCTNDFLQETLLLRTPDNPIVLLCSTCFKYIKDSKVPKLCLSNGLAFPDIPEELQDLTRLEEQVCSARIPFMKLKPLGWDRQLGLQGNIVNVPIDVSDTVKVLPREITNSGVIHLALMRHMDFKRPYMFETVRPAKIYNACKYLVTTPAYKEEGITLSDAWKDLHVPVLFNESPTFDIDDTTATEHMEVDSTDSEDEYINQAENGSRSEESMLIDESDLLTQALKFSPGQGKRPISLLWDLNAEVLSFPTIYCGQIRKVNSKLTYTDIAKSEARNSDRRACLAHKLLYSFKKSQIQQIVDSISVSLRKRSNVHGVNAGNLLNPEYLDGLQQRNEGYIILKNIRSSPVYWEARRKDLFATIRQLGIPPIFHTVSAMEIDWPELIKILKKVLDNVDLTEDEAAGLSKEEKNDLVRRDPITCARYFDSKNHDYFNVVLKSGAEFTTHPIEDYFMRVEFQHRGSPHLHIFLWLRNAPKYDPNDCSACIRFIDTYITTAKTDLSVKYQHHRHTPCCRRLVNGVNICRFGIPYPPLLKTQIFQPLSQEFPDGERVLLKNELHKIKQHLQILQKGCQNVPFHEFLELINMSEERYMLAIRSNIRRPTVFLKREVESAFINAYNEKLLTAWRSNMDIQFVLDPYACARYLSEYVSKSYRGMSTLLRKAATELERGNISVKAKLKSIGSLFVNKSEVSAQEAAYGILGLQLSKFSRDHIFINTGPPEERVTLTKRREELKKLQPEDVNVVVEGLIDHYCKRAILLEDVCLADYAAWYNYRNSKEDESSPSEQADKPRKYWQTDGQGFVKKREFKKVIRYRRYGEKIDQFMYFREQIMLFHPWRNEEIEVSTNPIATYIIHKEAIEDKHMEFNTFVHHDKDIHEILDFQDDDKDEETEKSDHENQGVGSTDQNIFDEKDLPIRDRFLLPHVLPQAEYEGLINSLNEKQRNYVLHVLFSVKSNTQLFEYLGGGAGVGKSTTVKAIVQALSRYCLSSPGSQPDLLRVLICAPTGIAAFNIGGTTIHSTFVLPFNQKYDDGNELRPLSEDIRTEIASKLLGVKLVICDELSMVSNQHLLFINQRLQQLSRSRELFGGHSIIFVGDLWQLPPIGSGFIFAPTKRNISSLASTSLWENFRFYELDEIMRQAGDPAFANALNRMKTGVMTDDDVTLMKFREISAFNPPPPNLVWLFFQRRMVKLHNDLALARAQDTGIVAFGIDRMQGKGTLDEKTQRRFLTEAQALDFQNAQGLPFELILKKSIRYMITSNIATSDGLTNGAIGTLHYVSTKNVNNSGKIERIPTTVWLKFPNPRTGAKAREDFNGYRSPLIKSSWTPIHLETKTIKNWEASQVRVVRTQFPLTPAEAITIHKSQSLTFLQLVLTVHNGISRSLLYTGCSRATSSSGLWINGSFVPPQPVNTSDKVYRAYEELKTRPVILSHLPTPAPRQNMHSMIFYNIEHYGPHKMELESIISTVKPTIVALVETYTWANQILEVMDYNVIHRFDINAEKNTGYGTLCVSRFPQSFLVENMIWNSAKAHIQLTVISIGGVIIVYGYSSPKTTFDSLERSLTEIFNRHHLIPSSTILIGDFNKDLNTIAGSKLLNLMLSLGMTSKLPTICSTTKSDTQIDCVFSGIQGFEVHISTTSVSHHYPLILFWPSLTPDLDTIAEATNQLLNMRVEDSVEQLNPEVRQNTNVQNVHKGQMASSSSFNHDGLNQVNCTARASYGLLNPSGSNQCFANASIQVLRPLFEKILILEFSKQCIYSELLKLFKNMRDNTKHEDVTPLLSSIRKSDLQLEQDLKIPTGTDFTNHGQHDAVEFMDKLLDKLHSDTIMYSSQSEVIDSSFRVVVVDHLRGLCCSHHEQEHRAMWSLTLPVNPNQIHQDLDSVLREYLQKSSTSCRTCSKCRMQHSMLQYTCFEQVPRILIVRLTRLLPNGDPFDKLIQIPPRLDIPNNKKFKKSYCLRGAIRHIGRDNEGHYLAYINCGKSNEWTEYNDTQINLIRNTEAAAMLLNADILVYENIK